MPPQQSQGGQQPQGPQSPQGSQQPGAQLPQGQAGLPQQGGQQQQGPSLGGPQQPPTQQPTTQQPTMQQVQQQGGGQPPQQLQRGPPGAAQAQQPGPRAAGPGSQAQNVTAGRIAGARSSAGLLEPMSIDEVVQTDVYTVQRDTPVRQIVEEMRDLQVGTAIVTDDGTPVGVITDRKIAMTLAEQPNVVEQNAEDLIDGEVVSAMEGTNVSEVLDKMREEGIRRIPVVDENGELQGIVSLDDVLRLLQGKFTAAVDTIEQQYPEL